MKKIRFFIFSILFLCLSINHNALAYGDDDSVDDTCTEGTGILNRIVADITTLGLFSAYSESFYMDGAPDGDGGIEGNEQGCNADFYPDGESDSWEGSTDPGVIHASTYCEAGDTDCEELPACDPGGGMKICYEQWIVNEECPTGCYRDDCNWTTDGWSKFYWVPPGDIRVIKSGDKLCAQFWTTIGYSSIGCKYIPDCDQFQLEDDCFVALSCTNFSAQKSKSLVPISAAIIQCVTETIDRLFVDTEACGDGSYTVTSFGGFQATMRNAVRSCLMLYIILFGMKSVLGSEAPSKTEFFIMGAKVVLVMYFSTGININMNTTKEAIYSDGITTYMKPLFINGSSELANMVFSAGGSEGLCAYDSEPYEDGYSYLSLWDSIDCRILYYIGIDLSKIANASVITLAMMGSPILLGLLLPAFFSFQLVFLVFSILFFIFFLSIVIYFVNLTVISLILVSILIYLAPVFVPMVLFEATKGYYDGWLKLTASYALQPMVIAAYIAMMMTIYDQTMFGDCKFTKHYATLDLGSTEKLDIPYFLICDPHATSGEAVCPSDATTTATTCEDGDSDCDDDDNITKCDETIGYYINPIKEDTSFTDSLDAIFFEIYLLKSSVVSDMLTGLITLCLFGYLFFKFADMLSEFAGELTGGPSIGNAAGDPMALVKSAGNAALTAMKAAAGGDKKGADSGAESSKDPEKPRPDGTDSGAETSADKNSSESGAQSSQDTAKAPPAAGAT